jgi:hypothetical protein
LSSDESYDALVGNGEGSDDSGGKKAMCVEENVNFYDSLRLSKRGD